MQAFDAFISYSHRFDGLTAPILQTGLENLNRKWFGRRRLRIFRDETDLSVTPTLWNIIQEALDRSRFFVLLASPEAAGSKWVDREVRRWLETKPAKNILLVVTAGSCTWDDARKDFDRSTSDAVPPALFGAFPEEPLFLDLRNKTIRSYRSPSAQEAIATLAAPIHGKSKQELLGLELQLIRKRLVAATVGLVLFVTLAAGFLWSFLEANKQRDEARLQQQEASRRGDEIAAQNVKISAQNEKLTNQRNEIIVEKNHTQSQLNAARSTLALDAQQAASAYWQAVDAWKLDSSWLAQKALYDFARSGLRATLNHGADVEYAALSRDNRYALTVGKGFGLKVWRLDGTHIFTADSGAVGGGVGDFTPDGSGVVFTPLGFPQLLDMGGNEKLKLNLNDVTAWVSPSGQHIFTMASNQIGRRWDLSGRQVNDYKPAVGISCFSVLPDSSLVAAGTASGEVYLWSIDGRIIQSFRNLAPVSSLEFFPDKSRLLSVESNGTVAILDLAKGTSKVIARRAAGAEISPQGNQIAVASDRSLRLMSLDGVTIQELYDNEKPELKLEPSKPPSDPRALVYIVVDYRTAGRAGAGTIRFVGNGRYVITSGSEASRVWDLEAGVVRQTANGKLLSASPNANYFVTAGKNAALVFEADNALLSTIPHKSGISSIALAKSGGFATASFEGKTRIWDLNGNLNATLAHGPQLSSVAFSNDGNKVLTVGRNGVLRLWSRDGEPQKSIQAADITHAEFSPRDDQVAISSSDGTLQLISLRDWRISTLQHRSGVYDATYSPDGQLIASGTDRTLNVWNANSGQLRWEAPISESVLKLAFSPDNRRVIVVTTGGHLLVFETDAGRLLAEAKGPDALSAEVAPTGDLIATTAVDRVVRLWNSDGQSLAQIEHSEPVRAIAISRDGKRVLTGSKDGRARLWDSAGNKLFEFSDSDAIQQVAFSADGERVITVTAHRVRIWNFGSPGSIIDHYATLIAKQSIEDDESFEARFTSPVKRVDR